MSRPASSLSSPTTHNNPASHDSNLPGIAEKILIQGSAQSTQFAIALTRDVNPRQLNQLWLNHVEGGLEALRAGMEKEFVGVKTSEQIHRAANTLYSNLMHHASETLQGEELLVHEQYAQTVSRTLYENLTLRVQQLNNGEPLTKELARAASYSLKNELLFDSFQNQLKALHTELSPLGSSMLPKELGFKERIKIYPTPTQQQHPGSPSPMLKNFFDLSKISPDSIRNLRGVSVALTVLSAGSTTYIIMNSDHKLDAAIEEATILLGGVGGGMAGASVLSSACAATGPWAPACVGAVMLGAGMAGAELGKAFYDLTKWLGQGSRENKSAPLSLLKVFSSEAHATLLENPLIPDTKTLQPALDFATEAYQRDLDAGDDSLQRYYDFRQQVEAISGELTPETRARFDAHEQSLIEDAQEDAANAEAYARYQQDFDAGDHSVARFNAYLREINSEEFEPEAIAEWDRHRQRLLEEEQAAEEQKAALDAASDAYIRDFDAGDHSVERHRAYRQEAEAILGELTPENIAYLDAHEQELIEEAQEDAAIAEADERYRQDLEAGDYSIERLNAYLDEIENILGELDPEGILALNSERKRLQYEAYKKEFPICKQNIASDKAHFIATMKGCGDFSSHTEFNKSYKKVLAAFDACDRALEADRVAQEAYSTGADPHGVAAVEASNQLVNAVDAFDRENEAFDQVMDLKIKELEKAEELAKKPAAQKPPAGQQPLPKLFTAPPPKGGAAPKPNTVPPQSHVIPPPTPPRSSTSYVNPSRSVWAPPRQVTMTKPSAMSDFNRQKSISAQQHSASRANLNHLGGRSNSIFSRGNSGSSGMFSNSRSGTRSCPAGTTHRGSDGSCWKLNIGIKFGR